MRFNLPRNLVIGAIVASVAYSRPALNIWSLSNQLTPQQINLLIGAAQAAGITNIENIQNLTPQQQSNFIANAQAAGIPQGIIDQAQAAVSDTSGGAPTSNPPNTGIQDPSVTTAVSPGATQTSDPIESSLSRDDIGKIVGCVIGGIIILLLLFVGISRHMSRKRRASDANSMEMQAAAPAVAAAPTTSGLQSTPNSTKHSRNGSDGSGRSTGSVLDNNTPSPVPKCEPKLVGAVTAPAAAFLTPTSVNDPRISSIRDSGVTDFDPRQSSSSSIWRDSTLPEDIHNDRSSAPGVRDSMMFPLGTDSEASGSRPATMVRDSVLSVNTDYSLSTKQIGRVNSSSTPQTPQKRWSAESDWSLDSKDEPPRSAPIHEPRVGVRGD